MARQDRTLGVVYRGRASVGFFAILHSSFVLISAVGVASGLGMGAGLVSEFLVTFGLMLFGVYGLIGVWRASRLAVVASRNAFLVRDLWRDRVIGWSDITEVGIAKAPFLLFGWIYVPTVTLVGERPSIQLGPMVSLTEARARRRAELLVELVNGPKAGAEVIDSPGDNGIARPRPGEDPEVSRS